mmetsp:Transcript_22950/g.65027  ORF Transcript_22950/g.65027 Transcript_22950/m.65027 type:complete len:212 (+) Transcript_22950:427-1062(+)
MQHKWQVLLHSRLHWRVVLRLLSERLQRPRHLHHGGVPLRQRLRRRRLLAPDLLQRPRGLRPAGHVRLRARLDGRGVRGGDDLPRPRVQLARRVQAGALRVRSRLDRRRLRGAAQGVRGAVPSRGELRQGERSLHVRRHPLRRLPPCSPAGLGLPPRRLGAACAEAPEAALPRPSLSASRGVSRERNAGGRTAAAWRRQQSLVCASCTRLQ